MSVPAIPIGVCSSENQVVWRVERQVRSSMCLQFEMDCCGVVCLKSDVPSRFATKTFISSSVSLKLMPRRLFPSNENGRNDKHWR